ncbi:MAG: ATP-binding protein [Spartobacteria bacterium]|nr:ATP-binding protein [Spartobacteria bacterium]
MHVMRLRDPVTLLFPAKNTGVAVAVAAVREYAVQAGLPGADVPRVGQATEEAALYAIRFGYGGEQERLVLKMSTNAVGLRLTIRSKGLPLREQDLPQFDPSRLRAEGDATGLDAFLIRKLMDSATFSVRPGGVREVTMIKHLPLPVSQNDEPHDVPVAKVGSGSEANLVVRLARLEDAEDISRLALRSHGSIRFEEDIYYPERVHEMIAHGEMVSMVAVTDTGILAGHGALVSDLPGSNVEELTYGFAAPEFRGHGCTWEIADRLLADALARGVVAVVASAVTNHVKSQRSALHVGLKECALLMAVSPASRVWREADGATPGRISDVVMVRRLGDMPDRTLFPPERHWDMIGRIHERLGLRLRYGQATAPLPSSEARVEVLADVKDGWAWVVVVNYGHNVIDEVLAHVLLLREQGIPSILLFLPLDSPASGGVSTTFEEKGFFFAGVSPDKRGRENLILQQLNGVAPDYDTIRLFSPFGQELLAYVRACDPNG